MLHAALNGTPGFVSIESSNLPVSADCTPPVSKLQESQHNAECVISPANLTLKRAVLHQVLGFCSPCLVSPCRATSCATATTRAGWTATTAPRCSLRCGPRCSTACWPALPGGTTRAAWKRLGTLFACTGAELHAPTAGHQHLNPNPECSAALCPLLPRSMVARSTTRALYYRVAICTLNDTPDIVSVWPSLTPLMQDASFRMVPGLASPAGVSSLLSAGPRRSMGPHRSLSHVAMAA
jgi:hypothetical protein